MWIFKKRNLKIPENKIYNKMNFVSEYWTNLQYRKGTNSLVVWTGSGVLS